MAYLNCLNHLVLCHNNTFKIEIYPMLNLAMIRKPIPFKQGKLDKTLGDHILICVYYVLYMFTLAIELKLK